MRWWRVAGIYFAVVCTIGLTAIYHNTLANILQYWVVGALALSIGRLYMKPIWKEIRLAYLKRSARPLRKTLHSENWLVPAFYIAVGGMALYFSLGEILGEAQHRFTDSLWGKVIGWSLVTLVAIWHWSYLKGWVNDIEKS